jgi:hypothetical protein
MVKAMKYIKSTTVHPLKYNIILTRDGEELQFNFPPAPAEMIARFGYIQPFDPRCTSGLIADEESLYRFLEPITGRGFRGSLAYHTRKQVIIALHDTAILGYQRQVIIDPRISNEVASFWEIYLDQRVFPQASEPAWQELMADIILAEKNDENADQRLAEDIKNRLLETD